MTFEIFDSFKRFCFICFVELKAIFVSKNTTWQQKTLDYFPKHLLNATVVADVGSQEIVTDNQLRFYINIYGFTVATTSIFSGQKPWVKQRLKAKVESYR